MRQASVAAVATVALLVSTLSAEAAARGGGQRDGPVAPASREAGRIVERHGGLGADDPLSGLQWYLERARVFTAWPSLPSLAPVTVAVIDSGVDLGHPDLAGRIVEARTFVGGTPRDTKGHGTIIAGLIAAQLDNGVGIAGAAPSAGLLVAKVVRPDESVSVNAEAKAIRWAVDRGARVISISLSGLRSPRDTDQDSFSVLEADAIAYAVAHDVLVVASVGNGDQTPIEPWQYAGYPAALPHVLGVSSVGRHGNVPLFSNRDTRFNDLAAPGVEMISTYPRQLSRKGCRLAGYTPCAATRLAHPDGTSFSAPLVAAAAANLFARRPSLTASQVRVILERTAADSTPATGCGLCVEGRDSLSGWGELDGAAALAALANPLPASDRLEPNDGPGADAVRLYFPAGKKSRAVRATLDFWDDQQDVYEVRLTAGTRVAISFTASGAAGTLAVWPPETTSFDHGAPLASSHGPGARETLDFTASETGWYPIQARLDAKVGPVPSVVEVTRR
ncbi:MAG: S8 family serine peptidase [Gaiellales bacterium]